MANAFAGKRVRQSSSKLKNIAKRERRLQKIGLSLLSFEQPRFPWAEYFKIRIETLPLRIAAKTKKEQRAK